MRLLVKQELSAQSLAEALSVSPTAIRQHLETLEALGLVARRKIVTQPSRPTFLYRLSTEGARVFPKRYDLLLGLVVDVIRERHGAEAVGDLVNAAARRLAERVRDRFQRLDDRGRWDAVMSWLEGELELHASIATENGGRRITIYQCPFQDVAREDRSVCAVFFTTLIRAAYGEVPVDTLTPDPPACCALLVRPPGS